MRWSWRQVCRLLVVDVGIVVVVLVPLDVVVVVIGVGGHYWLKVVWIVVDVCPAPLS